MANRLCIFEISGDESPEVDRFADLEEDVAIGQLARPLDPVDLPLQFEDHFREAFLRRVQVHVFWLPASHLCHMLERRQVDAEPRSPFVAVLPPLSQQVPQVGAEPPGAIHRLAL